MTNRTRVTCWSCPVCGHRVVGTRTAVEHVTVVHRRICQGSADSHGPAPASAA